MERLALIVPTRGRPKNIEALAEALKQSETLHTDLILVCDDDDRELENYKRLLPNLACSFFVFPREAKGMAAPLNRAARDLMSSYKYLGFMGDDHRPRTKNWDLMFINILDELGTGLVYGNDLHQGKALPTAIAMTSDIAYALNGMVPPNMIHLYLDNFWLTLGNDLDKIVYLPDVVIEHCHPYFGKAPMDQGYKDVNDPTVYSADRAAFENYIASDEYRELLVKLR